MKKYRIIIALSLITAFLPYFGIPWVYKQVFILIFGLMIAVFAYLASLTYRKQHDAITSHFSNDETDEDGHGSKDQSSQGMQKGEGERDSRKHTRDHRRASSPESWRRRARD